ncbi:unnamed protein product [Linum tenue]|uniref:Uncharacterized protein n=1 Tax=Linum tenue TaxID=586396 RepID=A0AAV0IQF3_9ROSI|nr:unnamed protein product [Linum tenue]
MAFRVLVLMLLSSLLAHVIGSGMAQSDPCLDLTEYQYEPSPELPLGRRSFPKGFVFASATAAYQIEGAANQYCRGPSIWDRFAHEFPERIADGSNGDVALDHYHRLEEDIIRMKFMNLDAYRFSISWTRIIPWNADGKIQSGVNEQGIKFYHDLLDLLEKHGLEPYVTIWHWDTPQALEAEYGGFLSRNIVKDFEDYCDLLFKEYGHRIKKWITLNEPMVHVMRGYDEGLHAPGRCSVWANRACVAGDSATEPYIVTHNLLLAHAAAYRLYEKKYKAEQQGAIGITVVTFWFIPYNPDDTADVDSVQRSLDFNYGWYLDPLTYGRYPRNMVDLVGSRLPTFTEEESHLLKNTYDFIGLNYYTTYYSKNNTEFDPVHLRYTLDSRAINTPEKDGAYIGEPMGSFWQFLYPDGLRLLLEYTKETYGDHDIYITENGMGTQEDPKLTLAEARADTMRVNFYNAHLASIRQAMIEKEVKVRGFFAWSYADNYEWNDGYSVRFGLNYVNYTDLSRHPKHSACWYTNFCRRDPPREDNNLKMITAGPASAAGGRKSLLRRPAATV